MQVRSGPEWYFGEAQVKHRAFATLDLLLVNDSFETSSKFRRQYDSVLFYNHFHPIIMRPSHEQFRQLAAKYGLSVTHQRQVVYEAVVAAHGHYSPEDIYATVRRSIPSISLATVYNNLRLFIECGMLREVSPHASTLRVDGNLKPHHHLVCSRCKSVQDIEGEFIDLKRLSRQLPDGFDLTQPLIEVFGLCRRCRAKKS